MSGNHFFCLDKGLLSPNNLLRGRKKELLVYMNSFMFSSQLMDGWWGTHDELFYVFKRFFFSSFEMNCNWFCSRNRDLFWGFMLCRIYLHRAFCVILMVLLICQFASPKLGQWACSKFDVCRGGPVIPNLNSIRDCFGGYVFSNQASVLSQENHQTNSVSIWP